MWWQPIDRLHNVLPPLPPVLTIRRFFFLGIIRCFDTCKKRKRTILFTYMNDVFLNIDINPSSYPCEQMRKIRVPYPRSKSSTAITTCQFVLENLVMRRMDCKRENLSDQYSQLVPNHEGFFHNSPMTKLIPNRILHHAYSFCIRNLEKKRLATRANEKCRFSR